MPIHDWTNVTAGTFHAFHTAWISEIQKSLNGGVLPTGYYAMAEQVAGDTIPDVLTLQDTLTSDGEDDLPVSGGGTATIKPPPRTAIHDKLHEMRALATRSRRIAIRHTTGDRIVALLEIASPGNKNSRFAVKQFIDKATAALQHGFHLTVLDLFPPGRFDPDGLHGKLWENLGGTYTPPADKPLTLSAYPANMELMECYVEPTSVGSLLIDMPLFLTTSLYVDVPLEKTYLEAYVGVPNRWKSVIEGKSE